MIEKTGKKLYFSSLTNGKIHPFHRIVNVPLLMIMRKMAKILVLGVFIAFLCIGCKKSDQLNNGNGPNVEGTITLNVHCFHHSWDVPYVQLYLKRNVTEFPGRDSTKYEYSVQADSDGKASFTKLYPGNYYVYATGNDYYFGAWVRGQAPVQLNLSTLEASTLSIELPVSE